MPESDFMELRGTIDDYTDIATVADAYCIIEVADSSYDRNVTEKLAAYARAGITQYVIIDLRRSVIADLSRPSAMKSLRIAAKFRRISPLIAPPHVPCP